MFNDWLSRAMADLNAEAPFWKQIFESWVEFDILCDQLSGTESKTLRRHLESRGTSGLRPRTPKQQERWANLDRKAHANLAKSLSMPFNSNDDWFAVDQALTRQTYQRLADRGKVKRPS
jgi:hypothetical protein